LKLTITVIAIFLFFVGCADESSSTSQTIIPKTVLPKPKPQKTTFLLEGEEGTLKATIKENKILLEPQEKPIDLLLFFTSWCPSCKAQIPELERLYHSFSNDLRVVLVGLDKDACKEKFDFFCSKSYKENEEFARRVYTKLHAGANMPIPLLLVLTRGNYFIHYVGAVPYEILKSDLQRAKNVWIPKESVEKNRH